MEEERRQRGDREGKGRPGLSFHSRRRQGGNVCQNGHVPEFTVGRTRRICLTPIRFLVSAEESCLPCFGHAASVSGSLVTLCSPLRCPAAGRVHAPVCPPLTSLSTLEPSLGPSKPPVGLFGARLTAATQQSGPPVPFPATPRHCASAVRFEAARCIPTAFTISLGGRPFLFSRRANPAFLTP